MSQPPQGVQITPTQAQAPQIAPAEQYLQALGQAVARAMNTRVRNPAPPQPVKVRLVLTAQADVATAWETRAINPLQYLENVHQKQIHSAVMKLQREKKSPSEQSDAAFQGLQQYFAFATSAPKALKLSDAEREHGKYVDEQLEALQKEILASWELLRRKATADDATSDRTRDQDFGKARQALVDLVKRLRAIAKSFADRLTAFSSGQPAYALDHVLALKTFNDTLAWTPKPPKGTTAVVPPTTIESELARAKNWKELKSLQKNRITPAHERLSFAAMGFARISMSYIIEPFYLFRLLIQYRVLAANALTEDLRREASNNLTDFLHTKGAQGPTWLYDWLFQCNQELGAQVNGLNLTLDRPVVCFFVKGGRAMVIREGKPQDGKNDWDTQIVINPRLSVKEWYETFTKVHDLILDLLKRYKQEFFVLLSQPQNNKQLSDLLPRDAGGTIQAAATADPSLIGEDLILPNETESCKAELIDVGVPRRDTLEAFEQWNHVRPHIESLGGIYVPGYLYYIDEYLTILREVFALVSHFADKSPKRAQRIYNFLSLDLRAHPKLATAVDEEARAIANLPECEALVQRVAGHLPVQHLVKVILAQFVKGYELGWQPGMRDMFDTLAKGAGAALPLKATFPTPLDKPLPELRADKEEIMLQWVAFAQNLSKTMLEHLARRAHHFGFDLSLPSEASKAGQQKALVERRLNLLGATRALYRAMFRPEDENQLAMAVGGSCAAFLYADYMLPYVPADLRAELQSNLEPVSYITIRLYGSETPELPDRKTLSEIFAAGLRTFTSTIYGVKDGSEIPDALRGIASTEGSPVDDLWLIDWKEPVIFKEGESYRPTVARVSLALVPRIPELHVIWGIPVLNLRDLIREYNERAADAGEWALKQRLIRTSDLLKELLTLYESTS